LKSAPKTREFLGLDTEDDQLGFGPGRGFYLGTVWSEGDVRTFTSRQRLIRYLMSPRWGGRWVACHNLEYDVLNVFGPKALVQMNPCFTGSKLAGLRVQVGEDDSEKNTLVFFDTSNFLAEPLARLAELVGSRKLEMIHHPGDRRVTARRIDYCRRDTELVWKLAHFIQDGLNKLGGQMKLTAAASALDLFRRKYLPVSFPVLDDSTRDRLYAGYYGGRVECFRLGEFKGPVYGNDFNGMYVSVMQDLNLPDLGTLSPVQGLDLSREGMAQVDLEVPEHLWAGPLPVRNREKLTFPVGRLSGSWTFNELRQCLNAGCRIQRTRQVLAAARSEPYLRGFATDLRRVREETREPAVSRMAKLMGNSLYGKFAQRAEDFEYLTRVEFVRRLDEATMGPYLMNRTQEFPDFGLVKVVRASTYPIHANVIWSAMITAGARCKLLPHLDEDTTLYCDTDSVIGYREYPATRALGALAIKERYARLVIRGNKLYAGKTAEGWDSHAKGVPRDKALAVVLDPGKPAEFRRPVKLRTALRGRQPANSWVVVSKEHRAVYDKREMLGAGASSRPLKMSMWRA
jgi:hypothetical protein